MILYHKGIEKIGKRIYNILYVYWKVVPKEHDPYERFRIFMKIIIDVMGADKEPKELIQGALMAKKELGVDLLFVGDETKIGEALLENGEKAEDHEIVHADDYITMEDAPVSIFQTHKESSMAKALQLAYKGAGDAVVSAGNTGALFTGATLIVHRIAGVRRAALGTVLPYSNPVLLLDCGANVTISPDYLSQFACLGSVYMEKVCGVKNPRVGLLNNGAESTKGTPLYTETYELLQNMKNINFIGNVEGKDIPFDACDVVVCDGFTGNIVLKTSEGLSRFIMSRILGMFREDIIGNISGLLVKKKAKKLKKHFDPKEYGGAPFLGLAKPVIKAHGNSDARAMKNAIKQAVAYAETGVVAEIERRAKDFPPPADKKNKE